MHEIRRKSTVYGIMEILIKLFVVYVQALGYEAWSKYLHVNLTSSYYKETNLSFPNDKRSFQSFNKSQALTTWRNDESK